MNHVSYIKLGKLKAFLTRPCVASGTLLDEDTGSSPKEESEFINIYQHISGKSLLIQEWFCLEIYQQISSYMCQKTPAQDDSLFELGQIGNGLSAQQCDSPKYIQL